MSQNHLRAVGEPDLDALPLVNLLIMPTRHIEAGKVGVTFHSQQRTEWNLDFEQMVLVPAACASIAQVFRQFKDIALNATGGETLLRLPKDKWARGWPDHPLYFPGTSFLTKTGEKMMMVKAGAKGPESSLVDFNESPLSDSRIPMFIR